MNDSQIFFYQMFGRVVLFGLNHQPEFDPAAKTNGCFSRVDRIMRGIEGAAADQRGGGINAKLAMFDELELALTNIARTARCIEEDEPGFAQKFRLPDNRTYGTLFIAADGVLGELNKTGVAEKFIAHEMAKDFVPRLQSIRDGIAATQADEENDGRKGVRSTALIDRLIRDGNKEVRAINAIVHNKYPRDSVILREWDTARHVERAHHRTTSAETTPATDTVPVANANANANANGKAGGTGTGTASAEEVIPKT